MKTIRRNRQSGSLTANQMDFEFYNTNSPSTINRGSALTGSYSGNRLVMRDSVTEGWKGDRKKLGWVNNPAAFSRLTVTPSNGELTTSSVPSGGVSTVRTWRNDVLGFAIGPLHNDSWGDLSDIQYPDILALNPILNGSIIECLSRIAPASSQSLVTALELPKTINLIASTAAKFVDARKAVIRFDVLKLKKMFGPPPRQFSRLPDTAVLWDENGNPMLRPNGKSPAKWKHLRKLNPSEFQKMDEVSKLWLEYRYGWAPLVYDLVDQMKALDAELRRVERAKAQGSIDYVVQKATGLRTSKATSSTTHSSANHSGGTFHWRRDLSQELTVRSYAYYRVRPTGILSRLNDFGAFDIPKTLWEIVPFSFVADWFAPIGDWLGALTPKVGVEILVSGYRVTETKTVVRTLTGYTPAGSGPGTWQNSPVAIGTSDSATNYMWSRHVGLPVPTFPPIDVKLNVKRIADATALIKRMR